MPLPTFLALSVTFTSVSTGAATTHAWEKNNGVDGWVTFDGTPNAVNPTEDFEVGTWDVRLSVSNAGGVSVETKLDYLTVDAGAPRVDFAVIGAAGNSILIRHTESVNGHTGYVVEADGDPIDLTYVSGEGTTDLTFSLDPTVLLDQEVTWEYVPGDIEGVDPVLPMLADSGSVINDSTQTRPTLLSATIPEAGETIILVFSRAVDHGVSADDGFSFDELLSTMGTYDSGTGTDTLVYTLAVPPNPAGMGVVYHLSGGTVVAANGIQMAAVTAFLVTNNSTQ